MNKQRRKQIETISEELEALKERIDELREEEEEYFNNMPEAFQFGRKGECSETCITGIEDAIFAVEEALDYLNAVVIEN